jgi:hypothetical protein
MSPAGFGPENDYAGEAQQQTVNDRPVLSWERMLHKDYNRKSSVEKEISGRGSEGPLRQDEPPVAK